MAKIKYAKIKLKNLKKLGSFAQIHANITGYYVGKKTLYEEDFFDKTDLLTNKSVKKEDIIYQDYLIVKLYLPNIFERIFLRRVKYLYLGVFNTGSFLKYLMKNSDSIESLKTICEFRLHHKAYTVEELLDFLDKEDYEIIYR